MAKGSGRERRREPRIRIRATVHSQVFATMDARVVDLSAVGALLEHVEPIRPGGACELVIEDTPEDLRLRCRIVRSVLTQPEEAAARRQIRYRTGVEFVDPSPAQTQLMEVLIRRQRGNGGGSFLSGLQVFFRF